MSADVVQQQAGSDARGAHLIAAAVLISVYALIPCVSFMVALFSVVMSESNKVEAGMLVAVLSALSAEGDTAAKLLPKILLPITAVLTGASIDRLRGSVVGSYMFVVPLVGVLLSLGLAVLFEVASSVDVGESKGAIVALCYEMATNLGVYLMLMLGLGIGQAAHPTEEE